MQYFILMPGDTEQDALNEANLLGEASLGNFWAGTGLKTLMRLVDQQPEILPMVKIKTEAGKDLTIEQFLTNIQKLKVKLK
jgi:hypothetical protein